MKGTQVKEHDDAGLVSGGRRPVSACIPASVAQVNAAKERQTLINHNTFLMM